MSNERVHKPVMCNEAIKYLRLEKNRTLLDCTVGTGGHAAAILKEIGPQGRLIGLDQDAEALEIAKDRLKDFTNCILFRANFRKIDEILNQLRVEKVDGMFFDLGVSSVQLDASERGFSIKLDAPLDMRMDRSLQLSAFDLVNFLPEVNLSDILKKYDSERWPTRIARAIVKERRRSMIITTGQLAELVRRVAPYRYSKIHPATRTFQALRIAVNDELGALREALDKCIDYLGPGARICVISFHSLEDRIVKNKFRQAAKEGKLNIITKKPISPTQE